MRVSITINHYRSPAMLKLALGYVKAWQAEYEKEHGAGTTEIIVTDSGTIAETREMMAAYFPEVAFLAEPKNVGFGKSVNRALERASGDFIFMMNADFVIPRPKELNLLLDYLTQHPEVGIVGPRLHNFDDSLQPSAFRFYTPLMIVLRRSPLGKTSWGKKRVAEFTLSDCATLATEPTPVDWLMGSALLTRKEHLARIGLFDERFFMYMEDSDLCRRFWEAGLKVIYYPHSVMYHFHGKASKSKNPFGVFLNKYARIHIASAIKYFRKYGLSTPRYGV
ncbi:MAG: glycosyltransferase family 2 protein [Candidatus Spechtbacterales bacterium]